MSSRAKHLSQLIPFFLMPTRLQSLRSSGRCSLSRNSSRLLSVILCVYIQIKCVLPVCRSLGFPSCMRGVIVHRCFIEAFVRTMAGCVVSKKVEKDAFIAWFHVALYFPKMEGVCCTLCANIF